MSAAPVRLASTAYQAPAPLQRSRPRLRIVRHTATDVARAPYFALCAAILVGALLAALSLNTVMATTAYTIRDRSNELAAAQLQQESLATQVESASAPAAVMTAAQQLGLIPSEGVVYLDLASNAVIGVPQE